MNWDTEGAAKRLIFSLLIASAFGGCSIYEPGYSGGPAYVGSSTYFGFGFHDGDGGREGHRERIGGEGRHERREHEGMRGEGRHEGRGGEGGRGEDGRGVFPREGR